MVSLGLEKHFIAQFKNAFEKKFRREMVLLHFQDVVYAITNALLFFLQATAFSFGFFLMKNDNLQVVDLFRIYAVITFSAMILGRVYAMVLDQCKDSREATRTVFKILERESTIDNLSQEGLKPDQVIRLEIRFENVHFSYPNRPDVKILNGLNLSIQTGQTNALVGSSGSPFFLMTLVFILFNHNLIYQDAVRAQQLLYCSDLTMPPQAVFI